MALAMLMVGGALAPHMAQPQPPGVTRTDLQRHDLSIPGREVVQVRVELAPGARPTSLHWPSTS
jgi:quercetin dioxygenase-like cupin family protein